MPDCELSLSQAAWNAFADKLKEVGEKITAPTGAQNERERAEGYRYLVRMISAGHELAMEADRNHPELRPWVTPMRKVRGDGPDTLYHEARLDEKLAYRLSMRRGDDIYFSATIYAYHEDRGYTIVDHLHDHEIGWQDVFGERIANIHFGAERPTALRTGSSSPDRSHCYSCGSTTPSACARWRRAAIGRRCSTWSA